MAAAVTFLLLGLKWFSVTLTEVVPPLLSDLEKSTLIFRFEVGSWKICYSCIFYSSDRSSY